MRLPEAAVAVVVHDAAPATWPRCMPLLQMLDELGAHPVTILVVPRYHGAPPIECDRAFVAALDRRLELGDELALHGYSHRDEAPRPRTLQGLIERRVLTRAEGEFAALNEDTATARLVRGIETFSALRWPLHGFVPPAWLLGAAGRRAVDRCGDAFRYVSSRSGLYALPHWRFTRTANLCYSPDRGWRRALSRVLIRRELARARHLPLLRLSLHPQDAEFPEVVEHWRALVAAALDARTPCTKARWLAAQYQ